MQNELITQPARSSGFPWKGVMIGCGSLVGLVFISVVVFFAWIASQPDGGVKMANEMETYSIKFIEEHKLLEPGEKVVAYYDVTLKMDGTESAILTDRRVIYHKDGRTTAISLANVKDVRQSETALGALVLEIESNDGEMMRIEIAPLNGGVTFKSALEKSLEKARSAPAQ